jgi:hypothetical protein
VSTGSGSVSASHSQTIATFGQTANAGVVVAAQASQVVASFVSAVTAQALLTAQMLQTMSVFGQTANATVFWLAPPGSVPEEIYALCRLDDIIAADVH